MPRRPAHQHRISRGRIVDWPEGVSTPEEIAARVTYSGSAQHKTYASPAGPPALRSDKAKCDVFAEERWAQLRVALQQAIRAGCVGSFRGEFPSRVWVWINGTLHEARLTNEATGEYHGFPINDLSQYPTPRDRVEAAPHVDIPGV